MRKKIESLVKEKPKHFSKMVRNDADMKKWVDDNSLVTSDNFAEMVYSALNQVNPICSNGNKKRFISVNEGFGYCGMTKNCECAQTAIAEKVSATKSKRTQAEIDKENKKREETNLQKYGVKNSGQSELAKQNHKNFYADVSNVVAQVEKQENTMLERYGVKNVSQLTDVQAAKKETNLQKYGVEHPMQNTEIAKKSAASRAITYEKNKYTVLEENFKKFVQTMTDTFNVDVISPASDYINVGGTISRPNIKFKCNTCAYEFEKRFDHSNYPICRKCNRAKFNKVSKQEQELCDYIKSIYSGTVIQSDRIELGDNREIDIFLPELSIGIEYDGLYSHSENVSMGVKNWSYHYSKWDILQDKNIQLITIFSDEWLLKKDAVKELLRNKIGVANKKIYARDKRISVSAIDKKLAYVFIDKHHIMDAPKRSSAAFGLFLEKELISVMLFTEASKKDNEWLLDRFCSSMNVVGGASKLLKFAVNVIQPKSVVSFSDNRYSNGNLYEKLGFSHIDNVPPMQYYTKDYTQKMHKLSARTITKSYSGEKTTEWEIMQELKYDRIWDCGKKKWKCDLEKTKYFAEINTYLEEAGARAGKRNEEFFRKFEEANPESVKNKEI